MVFGVNPAHRMHREIHQRSVELLFFGRTREGLDARRTALDHGGHIIEVTGAHFLLVRHKGVALVASGEFGFLHHLDIVLHAFAARIGVGELEGVESAEIPENSIKNIGLGEFL